MDEDPEGRWGDAWYYEDRLIYVHKRFVAIPRRRRRPDGDVLEFDRTKMEMTAVTYDEMRRRLLRPRRARQGLRAQLGRRLAAVPDLPPLLRPDVLRGRGQGARARVRAGLQRLDGRGVVRALRRREHPALPHPAVGRRARRRGDPAQRRAGRAGHLLQRAARTTSKLPTIHTGYWDPLFAGVQRHGVTLCMHIGSSSTNPAASPDAPRRRRRDAGVQQLDGVARRLAVLRQAHRVPEAEAGVLRGPDRLDPVRARAGRHRLGAPRQLAALEGDDPRAAVDLLLRADLRLLHRRPPRAAVPRRRSARTTSASRPTTRTPTRRGRTRRSTSRRCSADFDDEIAYKVLRGNAIKMLELDRV